MLLKTDPIADAETIAGSNRRFAPRIDCRLSTAAKQNNVENCACLIRGVSESERISF